MATHTFDIRRRRYTRCATLALIASVLFASACDDGDGGSPLPQPSFTAVAIGTTSSTASAQPVSNPFCPVTPPFTVAFGVVIVVNGSSNVVIERVRVQFTDTSGLQTPQITLPMLPVTLPAPNPIPPSAMGQGGSATTLPLTLGIGCDTGTQGTIVIVIDTSDDHGERSSHRVTVGVR
jgi:hypothetical protein